MPLLVIMALTLVLASRVALAAKQIDCSDNPTPLCVGTPNSDEIKGTDTRDDIRAQAGADLVNARAGNDEVHTGRGSDLVYGQRGPTSCARTHVPTTGWLGVPAMTRLTSAICVPSRRLWVYPAQESIGDEVECRPGFDVVRGVDEYDWVASDCECVVREQLAVYSPDCLEENSRQ